MINIIIIIITINCDVSGQVTCFRRGGLHGSSYASVDPVTKVSL